MSVLNDTNRSRIDRMHQIMVQIEKSARSNKASQEDLWELFDSIVNRIQLLLEADSRPEPNHAPDPELPRIPDGDPEATEAPPELRPEIPTSQQSSRWFSIYTLAQEAPLEELTRAVAIFLDRISTHLAEQKDP